jgi:hypothetical protein
MIARFQRHGADRETCHSEQTFRSRTTHPPRSLAHARDDIARRLRLRFIHARVIVAVAAILLVATAASAQPVVEETIDLEFDRPESWAMQFFAGVTLPMGSAVGPDLPPGAVAFEMEAITIPSLSLEQRTIGFDGIKEEDLNKVPLLGRGRIVVGLPAGFHAMAGWVPPLEISGVKGNLLSAAVARPIPFGNGWSGNVRAFGQEGVIRGAFTCWDEVLAHPPASPGNPFSCEDLSKDEYRISILGAELGLGRSISRFGAPTLYAGAAATAMDAEFRVSALRSGFLDRTLLRSDGTLVTYTAGARWQLASGVTVGGEVVYSPLTVDRNDSRGAIEDPLVNFHFVLGLRAR